MRRFLFYFYPECAMMYKIKHPEAFMRMLEAQYQEILRACAGIELRRNEPLSRHTSFRAGGPAALMAFPKTSAELRRLLQCAHTLGLVPRILGAGTNVLAPDAGVDGLVICLKDALCGLRALDGGTIEVFAGESMAKTAVFARDLGLTGLEFAHGIPGTVGGGVYMNAGAYGGEMKQVVQSVTVLTMQGEERTYTSEQSAFGYRASAYQHMDCVIVSARLRLQKGEREAITTQMRALMEKRRASQPLELPSAGSTFKRPEGYFAGQLIEQAGLKGQGCGGAMVSEKHAGFVVNTGGATAADILNTIRLVQTRVKETSGVTLEPEVRIWQEEEICNS